MKLVTIPFSHFNTRAKWALDHHGLDYQEHPYMPLFHGFGVMRHTRGRRGRADALSTRLSTPVLCLDDGELLTDSADIVAWADEQGVRDSERCLYPDSHRAEILEFEQRLHDRIGGHARRIAYSNGLARTKNLRASAKHNVGFVQGTVFWICAPLIGVMLRRALRISEAGGQRSRKAVAPEIEELSEWLGDRAYCFADRFTAADLTLACMFAPLIRPEHYGAWLPPLDALNPEAREYIQSVRDTRAGRHAQRMFDLHRGARVEA